MSESNNNNSILLANTNDGFAADDHHARAVHYLLTNNFYSFRATAEAHIPDLAAPPANGGLPLLSAYVYMARNDLTADALDALWDAGAPADPDALLLAFAERVRPPALRLLLRRIPLDVPAVARYVAAARDLHALRALLAVAPPDTQLNTVGGLMHELLAPRGRPHAADMLELTRALLARGADPNERHPLTLSTPLHRLAEWRGRAAPLVMALLLDAGADPDARDARGRSALDRAGAQLRALVLQRRARWAARAAGRLQPSLAAL